MAPSAKVLEAALAKAVADVFNSDEREQLSVNLVRKRVEVDLGLGDGFFKSDEWKTRSKEHITDTVNHLIATEEDSATEPSQDTPAKPQAKTKRASPDEDATPVKKRQRITARPKKGKSPVPELSDMSDVQDEEDETPKKKRAPRKQRVSRGKKRKVVESDLDEDDEDSEADFDEESSASASDNSDESISDDSASECDANAKKKHKTTKGIKKEPKTKVTSRKETELPKKPLTEMNAAHVKEKQAAAIMVEDDVESELSDVIDELPKSKPKSKEPSDKSTPKPRATKAKTTAELSPNEAEVKRLQGHLVKCGVRKIWGIELKKFGDDSKAKIRHLRNMLREVGMEGRFSESRAREIKERRELEADLEAVQEMNKNWGLDSGRSLRNRSKKKSFKEPSSGEEGEDDDEDPGGNANKVVRTDEDEEGESDEDVKPHAKGSGSARYRADLAFLGDNSESESE